MDRHAAVRSRDVLIAGWLLVAVGLFLGMVGGVTALMHEQDPFGSVDERCPAPNGVDGPARWECLEREMAKSGLEVALPTLAAASGCFVTGSVIVRRVRLNVSTA